MDTTYSTYDFIFSDLNISVIQGISRAEIPNWDRGEATPRYTNGLVLSTGGSIDYNFSGEIIRSEKGTVLFIPKGIVYSGKKCGETPNSYYCIDFETLPEDSCLRFPLPFIFRVSNYEKIEYYFSNALNDWNNKGTCFHMKCKAAIYNLLVLLLEDFRCDSGHEPKLKIFSGITEYIGSNFTDPSLNVKRICEVFYISESQLRRIFHKAVAMSPLEYIQNLRLDLAKGMLRSENGFLPIEEIAYSCGFSSLAYFSRLFKETNGVAPSRYNNALLKGRNY